MARRGGSGDAGPSGVAVVDKAGGWTSHDVVARSRTLLGTRKVGHAGTLDPDATGVLVLGVGRATRLLRFAQLLGKSYRAEIQFGSATTTLDAAGEVTATADMSGLRPDAVSSAARAFVGDIVQVPPMVSALKVGGRRLHELAREGIEVERAARPVTVTRFELTPTVDPLVYLAEVDCGSGTYVRSLAADLGEALGGFAHLRALRRTAVGRFTIESAVALESLSPEVLRPVADLVGHLDRVEVGEVVAARVAVGAVLERAGTAAEVGEGPWGLFSPAGDLLAVYEPFRDATMKPTVVLV